MGIPLVEKTNFKKAVKTRAKEFVDPDEVLAYNANIIATIPMVEETSIYSKLRPYTMGIADAVNCETKQLLANLFLHNGPDRVVDKKSNYELHAKTTSLVVDLVDFRKFNVFNDNTPYRI